MSSNPGDGKDSFFARLRTALFGAPKNVKDPSLFHKLSLIPLLAWIGLGADGLSSSSYGPEEAFKAIGGHLYLALPLAAATAFTVFIIAFAYSRIIEHFPTGGGGYMVATHMLGPKAGLVSGSALLVDYVLTITVSLVACVDALFSYLPLGWHGMKVEVSVLLVVVLIVLNIRGVKESIQVMAPIFAVFIITHALLLIYGIGSHAGRAGVILEGVRTDFHADLTGIGWLGLLALFLRAYSMGAGTYTGIEAVSNGLQIMREPKVRNGKRTMLYMAVSLALTAGGLFVCYLLLDVRPEEGRTLNAVLASTLFAGWPLGGTLALVTILSEGALLMVAAQAGFIDGPRVMANMAVDRWLPRRFADLSERLTMANGVLLMGVAAILLILYTGGSISHLIVMYSINVFVTFSISQFAMARYFLKHRRTEPAWVKNIGVHGVGFVLCAGILGVTLAEKFLEGGWLTLLITGGVIALALTVRKHYGSVAGSIRKMDELLTHIPLDQPPTTKPIDPKQPTAIQLVSGFNGFGVHTFLSVQQKFRGLYKNVVFAHVAVLDSGSFKGTREMENLQTQAREALDRYVDLARRLGIPAEGRMMLGTDVVDAATELCQGIAREFPNSTVFAGQLTFRLEKPYHRLLHNETSFAIQRRLIWHGVNMMILPIRVDI